MIRKILKVDSDTISITVPKNYMGQILEIIAFTREEAAEQTGSKNSGATFNAIALDTKGFKFNRDEANER